MTTRLFPQVLWLFISFFLYGTAGSVFAGELKDPFNRLVGLKADIEQRHGRVRIECFPFLKNIGDNAAQAEYVGRCLEGMQTLAQALDTVPDSGYREFGIGTRFLRSGGFHTLLVKWDATAAEMVAALQEQSTPEERDRLVSKVRGLKKTILTHFQFRDLYCTKTISNAQCVKAYETLASIEPDQMLSDKQWGAVVISDTLTPGEDPTVLLLRHDQPAEAMRERLTTNKAGTFWDERRHVYEEMEEKFGEGFRRKLQAPNVFCDPDLNREECLKGAETLHALAGALSDRPWGKVWINRYNTLIQSDYDAALRFDIAPEEALDYFSKKATRDAVEANVTATERWEKKLKNNSTGLRAVCDLRGLESKICRDGFDLFVKFLKAEREFHVPGPWEAIMFLDGSQLDRVNFALNSNSRGSYLYYNPRSGYADLEVMLKQTAGK